MAERYVTQCPAKINLYLRVGPPDSRGYHPLETEFQAIGLFDTLDAVVGGWGLEVIGMELPLDNTLSRTLRLMREVATLPPLGIRLRKRIPAQAGLGGGSSDAAGLLRILRKVLPATVPDRDFLAVAKSVGADVPFFLVGGRAHGTGYGDVVTALPDVEVKWLVVTKPNTSCSTPEMFSALDSFRDSDLNATENGGWIENDFNAVAPMVSLSRLERLSTLGLGPLGLCGSGSAVFGFASSRYEAERCADGLSSAWAVRTLGRDESLAVELR